MTEEHSFLVIASSFCIVPHSLHCRVSVPRFIDKQWRNASVGPMARGDTFLEKKQTKKHSSLFLTHNLVQSVYKHTLNFI